MISQRVLAALEHGPASLEEFEVLKALARVVEAAEKIEKMYMRAGRPKSEDAWLRHLGSQAGQITAQALKELERALKECGV